MHADFFNFLSGDAGAVHAHDDQGLVFVRGAIRGIGQQTAPVGLHAIGDPHLGAIDEVVVSVLGSRGLERCHIGAATGFTDPQATDHVARNAGCQELPAEFIRAKTRQGGRAHVGVHANGHGHTACIAFSQGFCHHHGIAEVQAHATKLGRELDAQQTQVTHLLEDLVCRELPCGFPFRQKRVDFLGNKFAHRIGNLLVFRREFHGCLSLG